MLKAFLFSLVLLATTPQVNWKTTNKPNDCAINAVGWYEAYHKEHPKGWADILVIQFAFKRHAVVISEWPDGLYAYDQVFGVRKLTSDCQWKRDANKMAELWGAPFVNAYYYLKK